MTVRTMAHLGQFVTSRGTRISLRPGGQKRMGAIRMFQTSRRIARRVTACFLNILVTGQNGAELLESALVLPILLTLLLGTIWIGRGYMVYETITRAAREGARYAVLPSCSTCGSTTIDAPSSSCLDKSSGTFQNYVKPALQAANLDPNQVTNYCQKTQWLNSGDSPQA